MRGGVYWGTNVLKMSLTCKLLIRKGQREGEGSWGGLTINLSIFQSFMETVVGSYK